ncbi:MAG TPA: cytochrome c3 family protein [Ignavibacteriaceae bacterium]|nr:cytochrome c3 family protein [Ignavibacteriaceae bacterium]
MKLKHIYYLLIPAIMVLLTLSAFKSKTVQETANHNDKIIKFSHKTHIENEVECQTCHDKIATSTKLSDRLLPNHDNCSACHDVEDTDNCTTCHFEDINEPLIQRKADLYFNHSLHVTDNKLECKQCHKGIGESDYAFQAEQPYPVMEDCYSCHNNKTVASNNCESCHISTVNLVPVTHKVPSFKKGHKFAANSIDANCAMCHDNSSCQECHVATNMITEDNSTNNFYQPYSATNFVDGTKQQQVTKVHELGYRFTHGIDAKGKTSDCQTCHELNTFCANCHQSDNSDFSLGGVVPVSHIKSNFVTIGVGTGGGNHSVLARRDIESCAACHDVQGADPTCITCHLDSDGIKGTNPKTHPSGFMRSTHGDWHDSDGSICYNCHTSASPRTPAGVGFCGYCHGSNPN